MERLYDRFGLLLGLILLTLTFGMAAPDTNGARLVSVSLQAVTLVAAVYTSRAHAWVFRATVVVSLVVVAGAFAAVIGTDQFGSDASHLVGLLLATLAPPAIVVGLIRHAREERGITVQTMFGVLCLYLLIGLLFASTFATISEVFDSPFFTAETSNPDDYLYFSFVTLTTVGYGDLVAATDLGRSLAITEALIGQIYLVTVVALIVSNVRAPGSRRRRA